MSGLPTRSEVRAASWDHLRASAAAWRRLGRTWESAFTEVHQSSLRPGGTDWTGAGAEAFRDRAYLDLVKIRTPVDITDTLAGIAERGADAQDGNKRSVLDSVDEIENDNFTVGEDWSVTDKITWYSSAAELEQRELEAQGHSDFLKSKVSSSSATRTASPAASPQSARGCTSSASATRAPTAGPAGTTRCWRIAISRCPHIMRSHHRVLLVQTTTRGNMTVINGGRHKHRLDLKR